MSRLLHLTTTASRAAARWLWRAVIAAIGLGLALDLGFTLYAVSALPPLQPWHTETLDGEFSALLHGDLDLEGYLQREQRLFDALRTRVAAWPRDEALANSRFNPEGILARLSGGGAYNRSFRLQSDAPAGAALLIHGLTDSIDLHPSDLRVRHPQRLNQMLDGLPPLELDRYLLSFLSLWQKIIQSAIKQEICRAHTDNIFPLCGLSSKLNVSYTCLR